jgi:hypothetical protein
MQKVISRPLLVLVLLAKFAEHGRDDRWPDEISSRHHLIQQRPSRRNQDFCLGKADDSG